VPASPALSVVVPTHNRSDRLRRLLAALATQDVQSPFEVIVVDDGSTDATPAELEKLVEDFPFLRTIRVEPNGGPAAARNRGWRAATAPLVAFTDDDCIPDQGWVRGIADGLARADVVQGCTRADQSMVREHGPFGHAVEVLAETGFYETCNMGYRRATIESLGGFDETFRHPFGEDTDLAWRAKGDGFRVAFAPNAIVVHEVVKSDFVRYVRGLRRIEGVVLALQRHPGLRANYTMGIFFTEAHPRALALVAAGTAIAARPRGPLRWLALAGCGWWYAKAAMRVRHYPARRRDWAWVLPLAGVADVCEIAVLARASLRYRTFFL
jgi:glycosyltransferase involved in cell wall biosynthesis